MEIFKANGLRGRTYYVFDRKVKASEAIKEAAHASKNARGDMEVIPVWIRGRDLFLDRTKGAVKRTAVRKVGK